MSIRIHPASHQDIASILHIGRIAVRDAHQDSCSKEDLDAYISANYSEEEIRKELSDERNSYHLLSRQGRSLGFSKIILNHTHERIPEPNVTKLDRIYLLPECCGQNLGHQLLEFNIDYARANGQLGIWLFTWTGNARAIRFYEKEGFELIGSHLFRISDTHYNPNHHMMLRF